MSAARIHGWGWWLLGITFFWWLPCVALALGTHNSLSLVFPFMGFYPWTTMGPASGYSETAMAVWGGITLLVYVAAAWVALAKNLKSWGYACIGFISVSSLLVISKAYWDLRSLSG